MARGAAGKARRKERRKQERAAEKRRQNRGDEGDPAGNFLMGMWNAMSVPWLSSEEDVDKNDTLEAAGLRREVSTKEKKDEEAPEEAEEGGSWWGGWMPGFKWSSESEAEGQGLRNGDEYNHVDLLSGNAKRAASLEMGEEGVAAELEAEAGGSMLDLAGKKEGHIAGPLHGSGEVEASMMSANVSGKGNLAMNSESISGGVEAEVGAHLLKAGATARGAMKLPFINAMVYGSGGVEGNVGYGAKGSAGFEADVNKGFSTSGELGASMGVGGGFKYGFGMEKADPKKGWFDSTAEKTYEQEEDSD